PRHHYFRRILCNYLGTLIENGEMTSDLEFVGEVVKDVCYNNSINFFGL
ncbi:MAG: glucuronate isomerase, partial [Clostridia bacterium]|nr:glucuronate isomerase [Clostridia bacterium]